LKRPVRFKGVCAVEVESIEAARTGWTAAAAKLQLARVRGGRSGSLAKGSEGSRVGCTPFHASGRRQDEGLAMRERTIAGPVSWRARKGGELAATREAGR
jgi:hypothetical protein